MSRRERRQISDVSERTFTLMSQRRERKTKTLPCAFRVKCLQRQLCCPSVKINLFFPPNPTQILIKHSTRLLYSPVSTHTHTLARVPAKWPPDICMPCSVQFPQTLKVDLLVYLAARPQLNISSQIGPLSLLHYPPQTQYHRRSISHSTSHVLPLTTTSPSKGSKRKRAAVRVDRETITRLTMMMTTKTATMIWPAKTPC